MSSKAAPLPLAERGDVHKSCKSLETLLGVLNDYCEAVGSLVLLQKKLAKALRDAAGMKTTGEIAANALNTSAVIFEVSSDVNSKFARFTDKEYDTISTEVKKWFKKLAKEEKMHDERMANANAKIKQAGQNYEKKTKKNPHDATEEHARYLNLITALGPEMSQEKYNHALSVTQRHATTTNNAASCLCRIADAEWLKTCESVRRFSPTVGQLGEWRSLCEGGWSGPVPQDLPDLSENQQPQPDRDDKFEKAGEEESPLKNTETADPRGFIEQAPHSPRQLHTEDPGSPQEYLVLRHPPTLLKTTTQSSPNDVQTSVPPSSYQPQKPFTERNNEDTVRSLSAFPLPPTHFPIPPPRQQQPSQSQSSQSSVYAAVPRLTESPLPESTEDGDDRQVLSPGSWDAPASPQQSLRDNATVPDTDSISSTHAETNIKQPAPVRSPTQPSPAYTFNTDTEAAVPTNLNTQQGAEDRFDVDHEFGIIPGHGGKLRTAEPMKPRALEQNDTGGSSGSNVAAMRNRYANNPGATSPTQKEIPRVSVSVNDLANRYQPMDGPYPARIRTSSASSRQLPVAPVESFPKLRQSNSHAITDAPGHSPSAAFGSSRQEEVERRRHQRLNDLAQLELKQKELEILKREQEIEKRAQELQRDRARLHDVRETNEFQDESDALRGDSAPSPYTQLKPRERKTSFRTQRPLSQVDGGNSPTALHGNNNMGRPQSQYSLSTSHLVPPSPSISAQPSQSSHNGQYSHSPSTSSHTSTQLTPAHAPYCGCEACSASKYRAPSSPVDRTHLRPPAEPINLRAVGKSKPGWIRRLSMPVGNAFNLDSKKGIGNIAGGGGLGRSGIFSMDGKKNVSTTLLRADEDGRRSYERSSGINQSMTNLGLGRR